MSTKTGPDQVGLYFSRLTSPNVTAENLIPFRRQLWVHRGGRFLLIWDRLHVHKAVRRQDSLAGPKTIRAEFLPPYAPERNPVEGRWGFRKMNPRAHRAAGDGDARAHRARPATPEVQNDARRLRSFITRTPLPLRRKEDISYP